MPSLPASLMGTYRTGLRYACQCGHLRFIFDFVEAATGRTFTFDAKGTSAPYAARPYRQLRQHDAHEHQPTAQQFPRGQQFA